MLIKTTYSISTPSPVKKPISTARLQQKHSEFVGLLILFFIIHALAGQHQISASKIDGSLSQPPSPSKSSPIQGNGFQREERKRQREVLCGVRFLDRLSEHCDHCYKISGPSVKIELKRGQPASELQNEFVSLIRAKLSSHQVPAAGPLDSMLRFEEKGSAGDEGRSACFDPESAAGDDGSMMVSKRWGRRRKGRRGSIMSQCCSRKGCAMTALDGLCCKKGDRGCHCSKKG